MFITKLIIVTALSALSISAVADTKSINDVEGVGKEQETNIKAAQKSQEKVDQLTEQAQSLKNEYRQVLQAIENNKIYNQQLRDIIASQNEEMVKIEEDIEKVKVTTQKITPLMTKMKDSLTEFVKFDLPFLPEERNKRVQDLEELFVKSGVTVSEKYRKVLEAYLIENEYGQTLEAYKDSIELDGKKMTVDFLKVGRLGFYYLTKDGSKGGVWNTGKQNWEPLNSSQRGYVQKALKVALKQSTPSLLTLPVYKSNHVATSEPASDSSNTETK